jgi:hypothetical protein
VNRSVKEATEIHVNKNNFNRNGVFVLSQARSFNKHVNRHRSQVPPVHRGSDGHLTLSQSPDDEDKDGTRNFD